MVIDSYNLSIFLNYQACVSFRRYLGCKILSEPRIHQHLTGYSYLPRIWKHLMRAITWHLGIRQLWLICHTWKSHYSTHRSRKQQMLENNTFKLSSNGRFDSLPWSYSSNNLIDSPRNCSCGLCKYQAP